MFFILSKVLLFLLSPFIWIVLIFIAAFIVKKPLLKKRLYIITFVLLIFFSNGFICDRALKLWEADPVMPGELKTEYDYAILLGGMASHDSSINRIIFHESVDRLMQTLDLFAGGKIDTIIISGGSSNLIFKEKKESLVLKDYLVSLGLPGERILTEPESRNTFENAVNSKQIIDKPEEKDILLITSAFHMKRAKSVFNKIGLDVDIYPAHFISSMGPFNPASIILPSPGAFLGWDLLIKEVAGLLIYKMRGYA